MAPFKRRQVAFPWKRKRDREVNRWQSKDRSSSMVWCTWLKRRCTLILTTRVSTRRKIVSRQMTGWSGISQTKTLSEHKLRRVMCSKEIQRKVVSSHQANYWISWVQQGQETRHHSLSKMGCKSRIQVHYMIRERTCASVRAVPRRKESSLKQYGIIQMEERVERHLPKKQFGGRNQMSIWVAQELSALQWATHSINNRLQTLLSHWQIGNQLVWWVIKTDHWAKPARRLLQKEKTRQKQNPKEQECQRSCVRRRKSRRRRSKWRLRRWSSWPTLPAYQKSSKTTRTNYGQGTTNQLWWRSE